MIELRQGDLFNPLPGPLDVHRARTEHLARLQDARLDRPHRWRQASAKVCLACFSFLPWGTTWKMGCIDCEGLAVIVRSDRLVCTECLCTHNGGRTCRTPGCKASPVTVFPSWDLARAVPHVVRYMVREHGPRVAEHVRLAARERPGVLG